MTARRCASRQFLIPTTALLSVNLVSACDSDQEPAEAEAASIVGAWSVQEARLYDSDFANYWEDPTLTVRSTMVGSLYLNSQYDVVVEVTEMTAATQKLTEAGHRGREAKVAISLGQRPFELVAA